MNRLLSKTFVLCLLFSGVGSSYPAFFQGFSTKAAQAQQSTAKAQEAQACAAPESGSCTAQTMSHKSSGDKAQASEADTYQACLPIATMFGEDICESDVTHETEDAHLAPKMSADQQHRARRNIQLERRVISRISGRLLDEVYNRALEKKYKISDLTPTSEEIKTYADAHTDLLEHGHQINLRIRDLINNLLETKDYKPDTHAQLMHIKQSIDTGILYYEQQQETKNEIPEEFHHILTDSRADLSAGTVREWKRNQQLFQEYGGRIGVIDGNPIAVDGWLSLLDYIETETQFSIEDTLYKDILNYERARLADITILDENNSPKTYQNAFKHVDFMLRTKISDDNFKALEDTIHSIQ